jgi:Protein of unknown function (DUF5818)
MKRWSIIICTVAIVFSGALAFAQQQPPSQGQLFSSDLVLWSYMQEPQSPEQGQPRRPPTPDPTPETQPAANPIPSQPGQPAEPEQPPSSREAAGSKGQVPTAQTFTGIIDKESDSFMLKVSESTSYKLDNQQEVQQYEGKRVRVTGTLDAAINLIHVDKIEPLS